MLSMGDPGRRDQIPAHSRVCCAVHQLSYKLKDLIAKIFLWIDQRYQWIEQSYRWIEQRHQLHCNKSVAIVTRPHQGAAAFTARQK